MSQRSTLELPSVRTRPRNEKLKSRWPGKSSTFIEFAPDPTIILDKSGCITACNAAASELFGCTKRVLRGKEIDSLIPGLHGKLSNGNKSFFMSPKVYRVGADAKLYAVQKARNKFLVDVSVSPIQIGSTVYSWVAVRKIAEQKLKEDDPKITQAYARSLIEAALDPLATI